MKRIIALLFVLVFSFSCIAGYAQEGDIIRLWDETKIREFVGRAYQEILGRPADQGGLDGWTLAIMNGTTTPTMLVLQFVQTDEFKARQVNNETFIGIVYRTCMNRDVDPEGLGSWAAAMLGGAGLDTVINNISVSAECQAYMDSLAQAVITESELCKRKFASRLKSSANPVTFMSNDEDTSYMSGILYTEMDEHSKIDYKNTMDMLGGRTVYEGLDQNDRGFFAYPTLLDENYYICFWEGNRIMTWGEVPETAIPSFLGMMKTYRELEPMTVFATRLAFVKALEQQ